MPAYPSSPHAFKKIKKPLHSSDLVRLIEPCGPLHDGEPKLYDRCSCSYAYGIRVRVHDGASLVGMYASCVFTSIRDFYLQKLCNSILIISWITSISKRIRVNQSLICVTQSNMTIVRYLSILNNKKSHRLMAFSSPA